MVHDEGCMVSYASFALRHASFSMRPSPFAMLEAGLLERREHRGERPGRMAPLLLGERTEGGVLRTQGGLSAEG